MGIRLVQKRMPHKSNFKLVQKYVSAELMKCEIGHTEYFSKLQMEVNIKLVVVQI